MNELQQIEWYRVRLNGEVVLGEQRNPSMKNNKLYFGYVGNEYLFRDVYPDGRYTDTLFNKSLVAQLVIKTASKEEVVNGGEA